MQLFAAIACRRGNVESVHSDVIFLRIGLWFFGFFWARLLLFLAFVFVFRRRRSSFVLPCSLSFRPSLLLCSVVGSCSRCCGCFCRCCCFAFVLVVAVVVVVAFVVVVVVAVAVPLLMFVVVVVGVLLVFVRLT